VAVQDGASGLLVTPDDPSTMTIAPLSLLAEPGLADTFSQGTLATVIDGATSYEIIDRADMAAHRRVLGESS